MALDDFYDDMKGAIRDDEVYNLKIQRLRDSHPFLRFIIDCGMLAGTGYGLYKLGEYIIDKF